MKKYTLLVWLLFLSSCFIGPGQNSQITANKSNYFPNIIGIDLEGKERILPQSFNNKLNIVVVAFKREQQAEVDTWISAVEPIITKNSQVNFYEIPLIYELSAFRRMWVNNGMRLGIPDDIARKRTITVYTNRAQFFKITNMNRDKIYTLLVDNKGKILWRDEGVSNAKKIKRLQKMIRKNT